MRRSNWKTKVIVVIAFILSIVLGVVAAMFAPDVWKGLVGFGTFCGCAACISIYFSKRFYILGESKDMRKKLIKLDSKKIGNTDDTFFNDVCSICFAVRISGSCCRN